MKASMTALQLPLSGELMPSDENHGRAIASAITEQATANKTPMITDEMSFAVISVHRDGGASTVGVIVWYRNSVVTDKTPRTKAATPAALALASVECTLLSSSWKSFAPRMLPSTLRAVRAR